MLKALTPAELDDEVQRNADRVLLAIGVAVCIAVAAVIVCVAVGIVTALGLGR